MGDNVPIVNGGPVMPAPFEFVGQHPADSFSPAPSTRADVDALGERIVTLAASGDGIESGFKTSEFWLTVLAVVADFTGPAWGFTLSPHEQVLAATALVLAYGAYRTWRKNGGAAKLGERISAILRAR